MHILYPLAFVLVWAKVIVCQEAPEVEPRQLERQGRQRVNFRGTRLAQMLRSGIGGPMEGVRKMAAQTTWGLLKVLDPDGSRAGPARVRQRGSVQGQRGVPQQGRVQITQEEYDYLNNFDDEERLGVDYYDYSDYSASGETNNDFNSEPVPVAPIFHVGNNNNSNRNKYFLETNNEFISEPFPVGNNNNSNRNPGGKPNPGGRPSPGGRPNPGGRPSSGGKPKHKRIANNPGPKKFNNPQVFNDLIQRSGFDGPFYPFETFVGKSLFKK